MITQIYRPIYITIETFISECLAPCRLSHNPSHLVLDFAIALQGHLLTVMTCHGLDHCTVDTVDMVDMVGMVDTVDMVDMAGQL